ARLLAGKAHPVAGRIVLPRRQLSPAVKSLPLRETARFAPPNPRRQGRESDIPVASNQRLLSAHFSISPTRESFRKSPKALERFRDPTVLLKPGIVSLL